MTASISVSADLAGSSPANGSDEIVFLSDLHLSPTTTALNCCFSECIQSLLALSPAEVFILGDLFDAYLGPDIDKQWTGWLVTELKRLTQAGIQVYFMPGNRDFLVSKDFVQQFGGSYLPDPTVIVRQQHRIVLTHGDALCTKDLSHQRYRLWVQRAWVQRLFLSLPRSVRIRIAARIKRVSRNDCGDWQDSPMYHVTGEAMVDLLTALDATTLVHGHTHNPKIGCRVDRSTYYKQIILPDWLNKPEYICYNVNNMLFKWVSLPNSR